MATILLVEDNDHIMRINAAALKMRGYSVQCAPSLKAAQAAVESATPELIVLDVMLPDGNGVEWCRRLRAQSAVPVLFLSALGESEDVIAGLRAGGDDYLAKPYDLEVLIARVEARLRGAQTRRLCYGELTLDTLSMIGTLDGHDLLLTQKEFSVLVVLAQSLGQPVEKETLYQLVWGRRMHEDSAALWTVISRLKHKLQDNSDRYDINSVRSEGYVLEKRA